MKPQIVISKQHWEREFAKGAWDYLDTSLVERARHAIIGMYCQTLKPSGSVLDIGCGEGTLFDFLNENQQKKYVGLDISETAIKKAKKKRSGRFIICDASDFKSKKKYDAIVFNEVLYYTDEVAIFGKYAELLKERGVAIISLYNTKKLHYDDRIWKNVRRYYEKIESIDISGTAKGMKVTWRISILKKR